MRGIVVRGAVLAVATLGAAAGAALPAFNGTGAEASALPQVPAESATSVVVAHPERRRPSSPLPSATAVAAPDASALVSAPAPVTRVRTAKIRVPASRQPLAEPAEPAAAGSFAAAPAPVEEPARVLPERKKPKKHKQSKGDPQPQAGETDDERDEDAHGKPDEHGKSDQQGGHGKHKEKHAKE